MKNLAGKHILVLGLGASGLALARWCRRCGAQVTVADTRAAPPQLAALRAGLPDVRFVNAEMTDALLSGISFDMVLKSPGLSPADASGVVDAARVRGVLCGNELSLFAYALADLKNERGYAPRVIGVTGTNGKTTVTALAGQLVRRSGKSVAVAGNIGPTLLDTLAERLDREGPVVAIEQAPSAQRMHRAGIQEVCEAGAASDGAAGDEDDASDVVAAQPAMPTVLALPVFVSLPEVWVLELSSFQLDGVDNFKPTVATVLNLSQDHLDWHASMPAYFAAKNRVYGSGLMLLNRDDPQVMAALPPAPTPTRGKTAPARAYLTFGSDAPQRPGDYGIASVNGMAWLVRASDADETFKRRKHEEVDLHIQRLMPLDALRIRGRHNATNALAALALAVAAGCAMAPMLHGLREYRGEPHRVESIAVINDVEYFDDSKGTNVGATVAAITGLGDDRKLVVILGGEGKGQDFLPLSGPVSRHARAVVLIGRDAALIRSALEASGVPTFDASSMQQAVELSSQQARTGDAVLMSPACASFDMFDNYEHRARIFREAVAALALDAGVSV